MIHRPHPIAIRVKTHADALRLELRLRKMTEENYSFEHFTTTRRNEINERKLMMKYDSSQQRHLQFQDRYLSVDDSVM